MSLPLHIQTENAIDNVIELIETKISSIKRRPKKKQSKCPTDRLPPEKAARAKARLKKMSENSILNKDGSDIRANAATEMLELLGSDDH